MYPEVKALLERGGIDATKRLLLEALIPSFKDFFWLTAVTETKPMTFYRELTPFPDM